MIKYQLNGQGPMIHVTQWVHKGGEVGVDINSGASWLDATVEDVYIDARLQSADDLMALMLAVNAIRQVYVNPDIHLYIPYVPYARQDRAVNIGESTSIRVFAEMINSLNAKMVMIADPHSPVTTALINNVQVLDQYEIFSKIKPSFANTYIVAPDQGATKKCEAFAKRVGAAGVVTCMKHRDHKTGEITGLDVLGGPDLFGREALVLDDICDGGRTFIEVAGLLRMQEPSKLELAVTHGIFSYGVDIVLDCFDHVYTTDSFDHEELHLEWDGLTLIEI